MILLACRFTTQDRLDEMEAFFEENPDAGTGAAARERALETVRNNIAFLERHSETISTWLRQNVGAEPNQGDAAAGLKASTLALAAVATATFLV